MVRDIAMLRQLRVWTAALLIAAGLLLLAGEWARHPSGPSDLPSNATYAPSIPFVTETIPSTPPA